MFSAALFIAVNAALAPQATASPTTPEPPAPDRPITHIVQNLGHDLKRMATIHTLKILAGGAAAALSAFGSDVSVDLWTVNNPPSSSTDVGRVVGDGWTMGGLALGTWGIGELAHRPLVAHVGSDLIRTQVMNAVLSRGLKIVIDRPRPKGGGHSFPSGHTSASFATASVLHEHFGWKAAGPAYVAALFVGYTRIRDRAHWLSDSLFGAALGVASAHAVTRGHQSQTWSVTPVAMPGGAGLIVRW
ncbi:MAG TPA: phosphatase PAP2 family protein [Vicinamibacterales bacterium]|nr:phosphatase PAP2 family protein [Vicinamibacterales bacterium]